jgi:hypothetical protein
MYLAFIRSAMINEIMTQTMIKPALLKVFAAPPVDTVPIYFQYAMKSDAFTFPSFKYIHTVGYRDNEWPGVL